MENTTFDLKINGKFEHTLDADELATMDIVSLGNGKYHLLKNGQSYIAQLGAVDLDAKTVTLKIGQEKFAVKIADSYDKLVEKMGLNLKATLQVNEIKAPMPGLVLSIEVVEGQEVVQGDPLLVLEAMKMENVIKSPGDGKVKAILTQQGKPVDKGEILIEME